MKICVIAQLICSFLYFLFIIVPPFILGEPVFQAFDGKNPTIVAIFASLTAVFAIINIKYGSIKKKTIENEDARHRLWKEALSIKLCLIPMFVVNFFFGIVSLFLAAPFFSLLAVAVAVMCLLSSSCYTIPIINHAGETGTLKKSYCTILVLTQLVPITDALGLIVYKRFLRNKG